MPSRYWLFLNNQVLGPYDAKEISASAGFGPESLVCPEGRKGTTMGDWQKAEMVPELAEYVLKTARVPAGSAAAAPSAQSSQPPVQSAPQSSAQPAPQPAPQAAPQPAAEAAVKDSGAVATMQDKIAQLEGAVGKLQEELAAKGGEISGLKERLAEMQAQLSAKPAAASEPPQEVMSQIQALRSQVAELESSQSELRRQTQSAPPSKSDLGHIPSTRPPTPEPSPLSGATTASIPSVMEIPGPSSGPHGLESLGQGVSLSDPLPQTLVNPSTPVDIPLPGSPAEAMIPSSGFTGSRATPIPFKKPDSTNMEYVDLAQPKRRRGLGFFFFLLLTVAALFGLFASGRLNSLIGRRLGKRPSPAPASHNELESTSAPPSGQSSSLPAQQPGRGDLAGPDPAQAAIELAKSHTIEGKSLSSILEADSPKSGLSPWMAEKISEGKFQVNFYAGGKKPRYQFEADLLSGRVRGLDAVSSALLSGAAPAKPSAGSSRAAGLLDDAAGDSLLATSADSLPAPQPSARPVKRRRRNAPTAPPRSTAPKAGEQETLDALLLPGGNK